jgi:predicted CXXCH cytochrome family protein
VEAPKNPFPSLVDLASTIAVLKQPGQCCLAASILVILLACPAAAKQHPVPLDPKTDSAKCLECHGDKVKGKAVHSAMATGCTSCHEIRSSRDITRVKLTTTTPSGLCFTCHADKKPADIKGKIHPPAVRDCLKCHDPHSSDNKDQLLKPLNGGSKDTNLCLSCHNKGIGVPKDGSRHAALDMGCDTCHTTHKVGDPSKREFAYHLTKDAPQLCADCHDPSDVALIKAHQGQPFGKSDCLTCHDPHQSKLPKLMAKFTHMPFEAKQCDTCHEPPKDGKVVLTQKSARELCVTCHEEQAKLIETAKVQHPGAAGDCTDCHNPHAGNNPGFVQPGPVSACLNCHSEQAELTKKAHLHEPAFEEGCATCHQPHGGENQHLLRASSTNKLCLECHGPNAEPKKVEGQDLVTIFGGKVTLPGNYFGKVPILPLKYDLGHPTERHPVANVINPKTKAPIAMNCLSCHQPHASNEPAMLVKDQKNNMTFCKTCHANSLDLMDVRMGGH